jgi:hypothetical protein
MEDEMKDFKIFKNGIDTHCVIRTKNSVNEYGYRVLDAINFSDELLILIENEQVIELSEEETLNFIRSRKLKLIL